MRVLILILLLSGELFAKIEMPSWWPAPNGKVKKIEKKLVEYDKKQTEQMQNLIKVDVEVYKALAQVIEDDALMERIKLLNELNSEEVKLLIREANGRLKEINSDLGAMQKTSQWISAIFRGLGGDWTAVLMMISPLLGSLGYGEVKRRQANRNHQETEKFKAKALNFAHMSPRESKALLKSDRDFPEIV